MQIALAPSTCLKPASSKKLTPRRQLQITMQRSKGLVIARESCDGSGSRMSYNIKFTDLTRYDAVH